MSEAGLIDIYFIPGPTPKDILKNYAYLTGSTPLPQYFSIGHHQCRWSKIFF
jgi:alpha 1,3-glucosidase